MYRPLHIIIILLSAVFASCSFAQQEEYNYDESLVPEYTLPDPLIGVNGKPVTSVADWQSIRRPEILSLFEIHVFGKSPPPPAKGMSHVLLKLEAVLS